MEGTYIVPVVVTAHMTLKIKASSKEEAMSVALEGNLSHDKIVSSDVDIFESVQYVKETEITKSK